MMSVIQDTFHKQNMGCQQQCFKNALVYKMVIVLLNSSTYIVFHIRESTGVHTVYTSHYIMGMNSVN